MSLKVRLDYFKESGKWYTEGEYITEKEFLHDIWKEVEHKRSIGELPGLIKGGGSDFIISVDVPDNELNHPHLIPVIEKCELDTGIQTLTIYRKDGTVFETFELTSTGVGLSHKVK